MVGTSRCDVRTPQRGVPTSQSRRYNIQYVQRPAALGGGNVLQRFDALVLCAHFLRRNDDCSSRRESALTFPAFSRRRWSGLIPLCGTATSDNDGNASIGRHPVQGDIATDLAGAARGRRKRRALDDGKQTRPRVWFATPRREHWVKDFRRGGDSNRTQAPALPFELKPKTRLVAPNVQQQSDVAPAYVILGRNPPMR